MLELTLHSFLWGKQGGYGLQLALDTCNISREKEGLGLTNFHAERIELASKRIGIAMKGEAAQQILIRHRLVTTSHVNGLKGSAGICDAILGMVSFKVNGSTYLK